MKFRTLLFDLDGTLADTGPDLAYALNVVRVERGRPEVSYARIRPIVSHGGIALLKLGFPELSVDSDEFATLRRRMLGIYRDHLTVHTRLFPGMHELLDAVEARGMNWGVVTNKPAWLTNPLMQQLGLEMRAACIVSGDTTPQKKPHPEPMRFACSKAGSAARQCLYIGDAQRDIEAGRAAGMKTLVAMFGYIGVDDRPEDWGADGLVRDPGEIMDWVR
jgi:phosphoglycolate phosphatase